MHNLYKTLPERSDYRIQEMKPNRIGRTDVIARAFSEAIPGAEIASEKTLAMADGK